MHRVAALGVRWTPPSTGLPSQDATMLTRLILSAALFAPVSFAQAATLTTYGQGCGGNSHHFYRWPPNPRFLVHGR